MLERFFPWRSSRTLDATTMSRWAGESGWQFRRLDASEAWALDGRMAESPARIEVGPSQRPYISGHELRAKVEVNVDATTGIMVLTRALLETLESLAFADLTDSLQTAMTTGMPEEVRWSALFGEHTVSSQGAFTTNFAVIGDAKQKAMSYVAGRLEDLLLQSWTDFLSNGRPLMIMLIRGRLYVRAGADGLTQSQWRQLLALIEVAAQRARQLFTL